MLEISIHYPTARRIGDPSSDKVRIEFVLPKRPFLFWSDYVIYERIQFPRGYGIAWKDPERTKLLFAPIPINILIGFSIWVWHWLRIGMAKWFWKHINKEVYDGKATHNHS